VSDFERFRSLVLADEALQRALWDIAEPQAFVARVAELGAQRGLSFEAGDVWSAMSHGMLSWLDSTNR